MLGDGYSFAFRFVFCAYVSLRMQIIKASWHFDLSSACVLKLQLKYLWEWVSVYRSKQHLFLFLKHLNWKSS